ncbi:MAG: hypothetical protein E6K70_08980, partial [Planctomycetota bacterium]
MKAIDITKSSPTLSEILRIASEDNVILKTAEGRQYVLAEIDDFAEEVNAVRQNKAIMQMLKERSREPATLTLRQVREQLQVKKGKQP